MTTSCVMALDSLDKRTRDRIVDAKARGRPGECITIEFLLITSLKLSNLTTNKNPLIFIFKSESYINTNTHIHINIHDISTE